MSDEAETAMRAITISREYGSGGGEVAARLVEQLGWDLIDHEVVVRVAQTLGVTVAEAETYDERSASLGDRLLHSMQSLVVLAPGGGEMPGQFTEAQYYQAALHQVVDAAVMAGQVVIVGRGAQVLLANRRDVLHVRIVAPSEQRITYVCSREKLDQGAARTRIELKDRDRVRYLQSHYDRSPDDAHLYDLVVNTGVLALDDAVALICHALNCKSQRLSLPAETLGPLGDLRPYPGPAGDLRPPEVSRD